MPVKVKQIKENTEEIKKMLRKEKDGRKRVRLQMLLIFKEDTGK